MLHNPWFENDAISCELQIPERFNEFTSLRHRIIKFTSSDISDLWTLAKQGCNELRDVIEQAIFSIKQDSSSVFIGQSLCMFYYRKE